MLPIVNNINLPESLKPYAAIRIGKRCIKDLSEGEVKRACFEIINISFAESGQLKIDAPMLQFQSESLFKELTGRFKDLTLDELKEAFKKGIRGETGPYFGLCSKTYHQFIKHYFERPERAEAMRIYLDSINGTLIPEKPTPEQQKEIMIKGVKSALNDYKADGKLPYSPAPYYDFLWLELKLIIWSKEEKESIKKEANQIYESKVNKQKQERRITTQQAKDLLSNISSNQSYINTVKMVGLRRFFDMCIKTNYEL